MKKLGLLIAVVLLSGCSVIEFTSEQVPAASNAVITGITEGEPVIEALEAATGYTIAPELASTGKTIAGKVEMGARALQGVAAAATAIPGPQQPIAGGVAIALGAIVGLAGAVGRFFAKREATLAKSAVATMIKATVPIPGSGEAVKSSLPSAAVGDYIEETYKEVINI